MFVNITFVIEILTGFRIILLIFCIILTIYIKTFFNNVFFVINFFAIAIPFIFIEPSNKTVITLDYSSPSIQLTIQKLAFRYYIFVNQSCNAMYLIFLINLTNFCNVIITFIIHYIIFRFFLIKQHFIRN